MLFVLMISCHRQTGVSAVHTRGSKKFRFTGAWPLDDTSMFTGRARKAVIWANALWYTGRLFESAQSLENSVRYIPVKTEAYERVVLALGVIYEKLGQWDRAKAWYSRSLTDGLGQGEARFKTMMKAVLSIRACVEATDGCSPEPFSKMCTGGNLLACRDMGVAWQYLGNDEKARKIYGRACHSGDRASCAYEAYLMWKSFLQMDEAEDAMERKCNEGSAQSCSLLAQMYRIKQGECSKVTSFLAVKGCAGGSWLGCMEQLECGDLGTRKDVAVDSVDEACTGWDPWSSEACLSEARMEISQSRALEAYGRALILLKRQCNGGSGRACENVAEMYRRGRGIIRSTVKSMEFSKKACDNGFLPGCVAVVIYGEKSDKHSGKTLDMLKRACLKGVGRACGFLAETDGSHREEFLRRGCDASDARSCRLLAEHLAAHKGWDSAVRLLRKACLLGDGDGCEKLGTMYATGKGLVWDPKAAFVMYKRACSRGNHMACSSLADMYTIGEVVKQDYTRARNLYSEACQNNIGRACNNIGEMYLVGAGVRGDTRKALAYFDKACRLGASVGCYNLGNLYLQGENVEHDPIVASGLFEKACQEGQASSCLALARMYRDGIGVSRSLSRAKSLYYQACTKGEGRGCEWAAYLYFKDRGNRRSHNIARSIYSKVCGWEKNSACHNLAYMMFKGLGGRRDTASARKLFTKECSKGFIPSCAGLRTMAMRWMITGKERADVLNLVRKQCGQSRCPDLKVVPPSDK